MGYKFAGKWVLLGLALLAAEPAPCWADTAQGPEVIRIWSGAAPGTEDWKVTEFGGPTPSAGGASVQFVTNVTVPTLTVFRPAAGTANGTAVIVCPGGGFQGLAIAHEGTDVARWLADRGITAFVLKYRVRPSPNFRLPPDIRRTPEKFDELARSLEPGRQIAMADAKQAIRFLRANSKAYGIAPDRIGLMGFSAGAMTTIGVALDADAAVRPNFAAPIYGAMEDKAPPTGAPPLFVAAAQDDPTVPATKSVEIFTRWTSAAFPAELHIYERGGHGFGALKRGLPVDGWMEAFDAWLRSHDWAGPRRTKP